MGRTKDKSRGSQKHTVKRVRRGSEVNRINALRTGQLAESGQIDIRRLPTVLKTKVNGKIKNPVSRENGDVQAFMWRDNDGRKMVIKRKDDRAENLVENVDEVIEALVQVDTVISRDSDGFPAQLIIELGPNDNPEIILAKIDRIDPDLRNRLTIVQGGKPGQIFRDMRDKLENDSEGRSSDKNYKQLLRHLEEAIRLENGPDTLDNSSQLLDTLAQIEQAANAASSKIESRNIALQKLKADLKTHRTRLENNFVEKLTMVKRTPSEVMVHLLHEVEKTQKLNRDIRILIIIRDAIKSKLLTHELGLAETRASLEEFAKNLQNHDQQGLVKLIRTLLGQLPDPAKGKSNEATRLQDNIYGRIIDSSIVTQLVNNPPESVKRAAAQSARAMISFIDSNATPPDKVIWKNVAREMRNYIVHSDVRFWFPKTPGLMKIAAAKNDEEALAALKKFLNTYPTNGQELIAIPYLLIKMSYTARGVIERQNNSNPTRGDIYRLSPWLRKADANYVNVIMGIVGRNDLFNRKVKDIPRDIVVALGIDPSNPEKQIMTLRKLFPVGRNPDGSLQARLPGGTLREINADKSLKEPPLGPGITLRHQPNPFVEDGFRAAPLVRPIPGVRPTERNRPALQPQGTAGGPFPTRAVATALSSGVPFASGISGSTNIMLHLLAHFNEGKDNADKIDTKSLLLATIMFLTYDGGHSIHEALWVANQLDQGLKLDFNLGASNDPLNFVADYEKLATMFDNTPIGDFLRKTLEKGLSDATDYFAQNSIFSPDRVSATTVTTSPELRETAPAVAPVTPQAREPAPQPQRGAISATGPAASSTQPTFRLFDAASRARPSFQLPPPTGSNPPKKP